MSNCCHSDWYAINAALYAWLSDKSGREIQTRRPHLLAHRTFECITVYCVSMRFSCPIDITNYSRSVYSTTPRRMCLGFIRPHSCYAVTVYRVTVWLNKLPRSIKSAETCRTQLRFFFNIAIVTQFSACLRLRK